MIREFQEGDAEHIRSLLSSLGFPTKCESLVRRARILSDRAEPVLVAARENIVIGVLNWHVMQTIHREAPVGRIATMIVDKSCRGQGIGRKLVEEACSRMRDAGCSLVEVTSNDRLADAHRFYAALGFERTSVRFAKAI